MRSSFGRRQFIQAAGTSVAGSLLGLPLVASRAAAGTGMDDDLARHLVSRTAFCVLPQDVRALQALGYDEALERLLAGGGGRPPIAPPDWIGETPQQASAAKADFVREKRKAKAEGSKKPREGRDQRRELQYWWIEEMLVTDRPLVERMVVFWHNHFTSSLKKVRFMPALYRQNELFRREALGNFATLLKAVARDPAMLVYLDGARSVARQPNENFGRELLELFTLGEGHYREADIKAAARAFTGWSVAPDGGFVERPDEHDSGEKTFLGQTGRFAGDDILDILLKQPRTAETIVEKLWREFVSLQPDPREVTRLAGLFRQGGYEIRPLLRAMLQSESFRDPANRAALIKSPIDLVIGTTRLLELPYDDKLGILRMLQGLGQVPFDPPNVKGWPGGTRWIATNTLLLRQQFLRRMIEESGAHPAAGGVMAMTRKERKAAKGDNRGDTMAPAMTDDSRMQLGRPFTVEDAARQSPQMTARVPAALAGLDAADLLRVLLPRPAIDPLDRAGPAGAVTASALLDVAYQLK